MSGLGRRGTHTKKQYKLLWLLLLRPYIKHVTVLLCVAQLPLPFRHTNTHAHTPIGWSATLSHYTSPNIIRTHTLTRRRMHKYIHVWVCLYGRMYVRGSEIEAEKTQILWARLSWQITTKQKKQKQQQQQAKSPSAEALAVHWCAPVRPTVIFCTNL